MPALIVALDGSTRAEAVLPYARAFAAGAPILLMTTKWGSDAAASREYLEHQADGLDGDVDVIVIYDREPPEAILVVAEDHPDALVCMTTHGRSGLGEAVLGSVAESVVRGVANPVLLVGPHVESDPALTSATVVAVDSPVTAKVVAPVLARLPSPPQLDIRVGGGGRPGAGAVRGQRRLDGMARGRPRCRGGRSRARRFRCERLADRPA